MTTQRLTAISFLVIGIVAACGDGGDSTSTGIAFADLPAKYAAAACAAYERCYGPIFSLFLNGADCVDVTTRRFENGTFALIENKIDEGTVRYDPAKARACIDAVGELDCDGLLERDQPACLAALDGTVALGGDCALDEECVGSALCRSSSDTCPGKCVSLLRQGQACDTDGNCDSGLSCSKETKLCVTPARDGESCENGSPPCGPGLLCLGKNDDATPKTPGTCRDAGEALRGAQGSACDPAAGTLCQTGLSCVAESYDAIASKVEWRCVETGAYLAGEACKPGVPDPCSSGNYCKTGTGLLALSGTCTAIPDALQPCGTGFGAQCKPGAVCVAGVCQKFANNGVSCTGDEMCYSEYCGATGGCEPRVPCQ